MERLLRELGPARGQGGRQGRGAGDGIWRHRLRHLPDRRDAAGLVGAADAGIDRTAAIACRRAGRQLSMVRCRWHVLESADRRQAGRRQDISRCVVRLRPEIGRGSCREGGWPYVWTWVVDGLLKKKK